jgi:NitT/TauT family transport system substrate-binding protein
MKTANAFPRFVRAAIGIAVFALGSVASAQSGPGKGETLRIQDYPGGGNTLVRIAIAKQYCEKYGIKCSVRQLANGPLGLQAFLAGELEVAHGGSEGPLLAISRGADIKAVSGGYGPQPFFLATRKGLELPNRAKGYPAVMADLKGKKIGVPARGSNGETLFTELLADAGMTDKDITYVAVGGPGTAFPALANAQVDALMIFSPVDGFCEVKKACDIVVDLRKGEGPKAVKAAIGAGAPQWMSGDYAKKNPHVVKAFRLALKDAESFVRNPANFDEVVKITETYFKIPGEDGDKILQATMRNSINGFTTVVPPEALQAVINTMVANKQLTASLKAETLILP